MFSIENISQLEEKLSKYLGWALPGYNIGVIDLDHHKTSRMSVGYRDVERRIPLDGTERYNMYSISKVVTAVAAMMLYERGKFELDDPVAKFIPSFEKVLVRNSEGKLVKPNNTLTMRHLLTNTSGITSDIQSNGIKQCQELSNGRCPLQLFAKCIALDDALQFEPGTLFDYGLSYDVLAAVIELLAKAPFSTFVEDNIFDPLKMTNSTFARKIYSVCLQYQFDASRQRAVEIEKSNEYLIGYDFESGGAGLLSTVGDMLKFGVGLIENRLISKEALKLMTTNQLSEAQRGAYWLNDYGYGFGVRCAKNSKGPQDFGWNGAAGSCFYVDLKNRRCMMFASHVRGLPFEDIGELISEMGE